MLDLTKQLKWQSNVLRLQVVSCHRFSIVPKGAVLSSVSLGMLLGVDEQAKKRRLIRWRGKHDLSFAYRTPPCGFLFPCLLYICYTNRDLTSTGRAISGNVLPVIKIDATDFHENLQIFFVSLFRTVNWDDMTRAWAGFKCGRSGQRQFPSLFPLLYNAAQQYSMHLLVASYKICCSFNPSSSYRTSQYSTCYFNSPSTLSI